TTKIDRSGIGWAGALRVGEPWAELDRRRAGIAVISAVVVLLIAALVGGAFAPDDTTGQWRLGSVATPAPATSAPATPDDTVTLAGVGDVIMGTAKSQPPNGGRG